MAAESLPADLLAAQNGAIFISQLAGEVCQILSFRPSAHFQKHLPALVRQIEAKRNAAFDAIESLATELRSTRNTVANFGDIMAASAHEAAIDYSMAVLVAAWHGASPDEYARLHVDRSARIDQARVAENYIDILKHFASLKKAWPDSQEIIAEVRIEAAKAAQRRQAVGVSDDPAAFRPASDFVDEEKGLTFKAINAALKANSFIRHRRPVGKSGKSIPNRLEIHAGDWCKFQSEGQVADPLDMSAEIVDSIVDAEKRKAEILARNRKA
jgi:hypothetical protein